MDEKTLLILEYNKILECLAGYCAFSVSAEKARALRPSDDLLEAHQRQSITNEAVELISRFPGFSIGGARDIRDVVNRAQHGGLLETNEILDVKYTMIAARTVNRKFESLSDQFPRMADLAAQLPPPMGIIDATSRSLSERGDILDSASEKLGKIRREMRIVHDRLLGKLQKIVTDSRYASFLQEALVTQRDGRYVIPLRAEFKGRIKSIVHDQSASGATLFVEPLNVVDQNNQYRELILEERDEERRILMQLSSLIGQHAFEITQTVEIVADLDLAIACALYADNLNATEPKLLSIRINEAEKENKKSHKLRNVNEDRAIVRSKNRVTSPTIRLIQARHPLLDPEIVVPIDVELGPGIFAIVITGPNTGGKTVTLKTIGLLVLMAQSGLRIPVQAGSELSVFRNVFADIGDEQSIEQSLSTFSSHITNIIRILDNADRESLVILDELGAGTDPQEGAALARALLDSLVSRGITTLVTTHHPDIKSYAHATKGVTNASVQFDIDTLKPTFHLIIGIPGRSNALAIAQRLGLPEPIVKKARSELDPTEVRTDDLLDEIHRQHDQVSLNRKKADQARKEAEAIRQELHERLNQIEDERLAILRGARRQAGEELNVLQDEIDDLRKAMNRARQPIEVVQEVEQKLEKQRSKLVTPFERERRDAAAQILPEIGIRRSIQLGDKVQLRSLKKIGLVTAISEDEAEVQVGMLRVRTRLGELEFMGADENDPKLIVEDTPVSQHRQKTGTVGLGGESPGIELDLRGNRADDAVHILENYLDSAFLAGLPFVRIIHGKGTGKLRQVVREALKNHPHVKKYEGGGEKEGGEGVTIIKFKD